MSTSYRLQVQIRSGESPPPELSLHVRRHEEVIQERGLSNPLKLFCSTSKQNQLRQGGACFACGPPNGLPTRRHECNYLGALHTTTRAARASLAIHSWINTRCMRGTRLLVMRKRRRLGGLEACFIPGDGLRSDTLLLGCQFAG